MNIRKSSQLIFILALIFLYQPSLVTAQDEWKEYSAEYLNVSFSLPASWEVELQQDEVFAVSDRNLIGFKLFKPPRNIPVEDWAYEIKKHIAFSQFDFYISNEPLKFNNIRSLLSEGSGWAVEFDTQIYFLVSVINDEKNPIVAFTFCTVEDIARNEKTMKEILLSFSRLN
ncbi:MAG: hypothetical protein N3A61_08490 [Ignavibacteria bacterium]|nr:hypothetical protein [Ignavibacteria bacterium]